MIVGRCVKARAALIAPITASVPELQNRIRSQPATRSHKSSAKRISASLAIEKAVPLANWLRTADSISGSACPKIIEVKLLLQSKYRFPSTSVIHAPFAWST